MKNVKMDFHDVDLNKKHKKVRKWKQGLDTKKERTKNHD